MQHIDILYGHIWRLCLTYLEWINIICFHICFVFQIVRITERSTPFLCAWLIWYFKVKFVGGRIYHLMVYLRINPHKIYVWLYLNGIDTPLFLFLWRKKRSLYGYLITQFFQVPEQIFVAYNWSDIIMSVPIEGP